MCEKMFRVSIFVISIAIALSWADDLPVVKTPLGLLRGTYKTSSAGRSFAAFEGIPYAKPPVGDLRFEKPQDVEPWQGTWDANMFHTCMQFDLGQKVIGDEDCLYLNVYVPKDSLDATNKLDVMVHFHGGAFMVGHSNIGPEYFMDKDVIVVSANYRVGILGFLSTQDKVVPGNNGLKDQVHVLKWVKNNIGSFGGNPGSVTIIGTSAGAVSTHFHYLSPLSKGLFHRGTSQSGSALVPWAIQEAALEKAKKLATSVGCSDETTEVLVNCLRTRPGRQVVQQVIHFYGFRGQPFAPFSPVVERDLEGAFITDEPYNILKSGKINDVPWLASMNRDEGTWPGVLMYWFLSELGEDWNKYLPHLLDYNYTVAEEDKLEVAQKLKEYYLNDTKASMENYAGVIKLIGDRLYVNGIEKAARMQASVSKSPVFFYLFDYDGEMKMKSIFLNTPDDLGVGHGDDMPYLYKLPKLKDLNEVDTKVKDIFIDIFTTFANKGYPGHVTDWMPVHDTGVFIFLHFQGPFNMTVKSRMEMAPTELWESLPIKENIDAVTTKDEL